MLPETSNLIAEQAAALAELLHEHNGQDVIALDLRGMSSWTDFFIIATVTSSTHMEGLERHTKEFCQKNGIDISGKSGFKKAGKVPDDEWRIVDLGWAVIHLMTKQSREFYELERLWRPVNYG